MKQTKIHIHRGMENNYLNDDDKKKQKILCLIYDKENIHTIQFNQENNIPT